MFNAGTFDPEVDTGKQQYPFDHNLDGLDPYTSRTSCSSNHPHPHHPHHDLGGNEDGGLGTGFLDEISVGRGLMEQFKELVLTEELDHIEGLDGNAERRSHELLRRLTIDRRRGVSAGTIIERRAVSEDERAHAAPAAMLENDSQEVATPASEVCSRKPTKGKQPVRLTESTQSEPIQRRPTIVRSFTAPLPTPTAHYHRSSSDEARAVLGVDMPRLLLYNYFLRRIDNIQLLSPNSAFTGKPEDFELLRLLASTHQDGRWWTVSVDDLACPQCVEELGRRKEDRNGYLARKERKKWAKAMLRPKCWGWLVRKGRRRMHCGGGECRVVCGHREREANNVTRFFDQLGPKAAEGMRNVLLEMPDVEIPNVDALVSCVQNVRYYFPNIQQLEICFHLGFLETAEKGPKLVRKMDKDTWTRILCCLVDLESLLPKNHHLRVNGLEGCDELLLGWGRRKRKWYHGKKDGKPFAEKPKCWQPRGG